ncbi:hypothetical protein P7K49_005836 [Saguinus oedipus]|uniref:Uncharacterized protein n=1 Tax=Saguinus oedipus TaxID=9490 RepID=A0ABQ9W196_SAGOE|nr:hypothetical protein P7K49_005836 [Saguinus oedipus]
MSGLGGKGASKTAGQSPAQGEPPRPRGRRPGQSEREGGVRGGDRGGPEEPRAASAPPSAAQPPWIDRHLALLAETLTLASRLLPCLPRTHPVNVGTW